MNKVITIDGKRKRDSRDVYEDLEDKLRDIHVVADLLGNVNGDAFQEDQVNAAGYCLTRMIEGAQALNAEYWELWKRDLGQSGSAS